jgi:hypothetical protein
VIGSVPWRLANYGLSPTLKYLRERSQSKTIITRSVAEISLAKFLNLTSAKNPVEVTKKAQSIVFSTFTDLRESYQSALESGIAIKAVLNENSSVSRLIVLAALLDIFEVNTFIETGTQHGISASVVAKCNAEKNLNLSMYSIDVGLPYLINRESDVKYIRLKRPARKVFKKITFEIAKGKTMFFHDSDHTYENMYFEYSWAWNKLGAEILVSDDINLNNAFSNFCSDNSLKEYRIKMDSGTTIGVAIRQNNKNGKDLSDY